MDYRSTITSKTSTKFLIHLQYTIFEHDTNFRVLVQLNTGEELTVDHILVAVGLKPSTELGDTAGLEVHGEMGEKLRYHGYLGHGLR